MPKLPNGTTVENESGDYSPHLSVLRFDCNSGHVLSNSSQATCHNGTWSLIPQCLPGKCISLCHIDLYIYIYIITNCLWWHCSAQCYSLNKYILKINNTNDMQPGSQPMGRGAEGMHKSPLLHRPVLPPFFAYLS